MSVTIIRLWEPTAECCLCGEETPPTHSVGYCCGPTHDEIGTQSTQYPGHEVCGMTACKPCHDKFYGIGSDQ